MLPASYFDTATNALESHFHALNNWVYNDIARRLKAAEGLTATAEYQLKRAVELRLFNDDYKKRLQQLLKLSDAEIDRLFEEAANKTYGYDKDLFTARGIPFVPLAENIALQQIVYSAAEQMKSDIGTITNSTALKMINPYGNPVSIPSFYAQTLDNVTLRVSSGVTSYDEAIKRAVKDMVQNGINIVRYEGPDKRPVNRRIEGVVRSNVLTAIGQMADNVTWYNIDQLGAEYVVMSAHVGARTGIGFAGHVNWQGRIYALNGFKP